MMSSLLRWVSNEKIDRLTQWMLRRLFKIFLKKYIGPYIRGELDLEQLHFQLCSGAHLNHIFLNADAINAQLVDYPIALKEGSVGKVSVKLLPKLSIELDDVELQFAPQRGANAVQSKTSPSEFTSETQQLRSDSESVDLGSVGGYSYLPVQEGVRVVANLFERLFFGAHVIVNSAFIAIEETPNLKSVQDSHCMLLVRIGCAEYKASRSASNERDRQDEEFSAFSSIFSFQQTTFELVDVQSDHSLHVSSNDTKLFGKPVSLLQDGNVLSGTVKLSILSNNGSLEVPKVDADISLIHIKLQFTAQQIQQILRVISSYAGSSSSANEYVASSSSDFFNARTATETMDSRETTAWNPALLASQIQSSRQCLLPGAKIIADWVQWNDQDNSTREAVLSEEEFAASTEEFFDCLSGSGLWMWTCSAFSAISAASSLASGSVLVSQEFPRQVSYLVKGKIAGLSISLKEAKGQHGPEVDAKLSPVICTKDNKKLRSRLLESANSGYDHARNDHVEVTFMDIDVSLEACQKCWQWQLAVKQIEAYQVKYQDQSVFPSHELDGDVLPELVGHCPQSLQALTEHYLPKFPVSLCEGKERKKTRTDMRKCFLRLSDQGRLAGVKVSAKHKFSSFSSGKSCGRSQDLTDISFHFQPVVAWLDASVIRMLHRWAGSSGHDDNLSMTVGPASTRGFVSRQKVHLNMCFSCVRILACSPYSSTSRLLKDHLLCLELSSLAENLKQPMVELRLSNMSQTQGKDLCLDCLTLSIGEGSLHLISPNIEISRKASSLCFCADKILSISSSCRELAKVEILFRVNPGGGPRLAECVWTAVMEQQNGGMGGRKTNSEFAAATVTETTDENNHKVRRDIHLHSATSVSVSIPCVSVELHDSQYAGFIGIVLGLVEASMLEMPRCGDPVGKTDHQTSISLEVGEMEIVVHPKLDNLESSQKKRNSSWGGYTISVVQLKLLHAVNLGMMKNASYFWLHHGNGQVRGLLLDANPVELQLLTCRDTALGRGDGGGGNALATSSAGLELTVISLPGGGHEEDMLITMTMGGCTFLAHGGRLDWLPGLVTFFSQHAEASPCYGICERITGNETSLLKLQTVAPKSKKESPVTDNRVLFSLNLHDVALCYEPADEAVSAANLRASSSTGAQGSAMEQFSPVACSVAAAAVRVSSNAISNTASKDYEIWLRDVALLLADTTLRKTGPLEYTPECLHQAGYVKVAGEAVMEAVVHLNGDEGLDWEVECANNQLRLDTCHDTTAALGRLIGQLQQLFVPEVEHSAIEKRVEHVNGCYFRERSGLQPHNHNEGKSQNASLFEGFLEDASLLIRGCSLHPDRPCSCLNPEVNVNGRHKQLGNSLLPSDDATEGSLDGFLDQWSSEDGQAEEDFRTPVPQDDEAPSFIEDYYVTRRSSVQSSQGSSYKDSTASVHSFQNPLDDFALPNMADGSGGWYDGHSFKVVENHVSASCSRLALKKQGGNLMNMSKMKPSLSLKYPRSVGRVVFQDLNLRWRLYGGSDWPDSKRIDPVTCLYSSQAASGRQSEICLEVIFDGMDLQHDTFPETEAYASRLALSIRDVGIYDCSKDAPWRKILGYHRTKSRPRESFAKALRLELESVRPDPVVPLEEYRLSVQLLPLLLHLDQRHVDFLINFLPPATASLQPLHSGYVEIVSPYSTLDTKVTEGCEEALLPFFQVCDLQAFSIRVDYAPRRVDIGAIRSGNFAELANLVSWKGIELELKHVRAMKVHGWGALSGIVVGEWLEDISQNQIHKVIKGLGPIRPLFAVGSGAAKLVVLPAEQYKRDRRRLLRGMHRGAIAFLQSVSVEAVGLGVQLAAGAHEILLQTESALGHVCLSSSLEKSKVQAKVGQPEDMCEGLRQACESLTRGLERTASSLVGNPLKVYHRGASRSTAVASALKAAPSATVAPVAAAAGALHRALLGVRNSLDPERRVESEEKYSAPPPE